MGPPNYNIQPTPGAGGAAATNNSAAAENSDPQNGKTVGGISGQNSRRLAEATAEGRRLHLSPSEMTAVSAAPLTPFDPESPEHPRDGAGGAGVGAGQEEEEEMVASPLRQRSSRGDMPTTPGSISKLDGVGDDDDGTDDLFPVADDDDDHHLGIMGLHEEMDHSPPPPENSAEDLIHNTSFEQEEAEREEAEAAAKKKAAEEAAAAAKKKADEDEAAAAAAAAMAEDDDSDDKDEGVGFQMADHDDDDDMPPPDSPPVSTGDAQEEGEEEDVANAAKKSKKKSKGKVAARDDDSASAEITPEDGKKKKKKRRNKRVTYADRVNNFSTPTGKRHGYPAGNRGYTVIPISEFKNADASDDDGEDNGRRRSKRNRVAPLAYWKNERLEYVAHKEEGSLGEAMGDMAVVGGVVQANPTPYKERKDPPPKKKGKRKGGDSDDESTYAPREAQRYDTKKLRKVSCFRWCLGSLYLFHFIQYVQIFMHFLYIKLTRRFPSSLILTLNRNMTTSTTRRPWRGMRPTRNPWSGSWSRTVRAESWPTCPYPSAARRRARSSPVPLKLSTSRVSVTSPVGSPVSSICPPLVSRMPNPSAFAVRYSMWRAASPRHWSLPWPIPTRATRSFCPRRPSDFCCLPAICFVYPRATCTALKIIPRPTSASCSGPSSVPPPVKRKGSYLHVDTSLPLRIRYFYVRKKG